MARVTPSKDGTPRMTLQIQIRVDAELFACLLAYRAFSNFTTAEGRKFFLDTLTAASAVEVARGMMWTESTLALSAIEIPGGGVCDDAIAKVAELFPDFAQPVPCKKGAKR